MFEAGAFAGRVSILNQFITGRSIISSSYWYDGERQTIIYDIDSGASRDITLPGNPGSTVRQTDFIITGVEGRTAVGYTSVTALSHRAFTYDISTGETAYIPPLPGGTSAQAMAVSGGVAVGMSTGDEQRLRRAFTYSLATGEMTDITAAMHGGSGAALAAGGGVAAGYVYINSVLHLFAYDLADRRATDCGVWPGEEPGDKIESVWVNKDFVVVRAFISQPYTFACRVADGAVIPIKAPGDTSRYVTALDGHTVAGWFTGNGGRNEAFAFDLDNRKMTVIPPLNERDTSGDEHGSVATEISGHIVFGISTVSLPIPGVQRHAFSYDLDSGEMRDLDTLGTINSMPYAAAGNIVAGLFLAVPNDGHNNRAFGYILP